MYRIFRYNARPTLRPKPCLPARTRERIVASGAFPEDQIWRQPASTRALASASGNGYAVPEGTARPSACRRAGLVRRARSGSNI